MTIPEYNLLPDLVRFTLPDPRVPEKKRTLDLDIVKTARDMETIAADVKARGGNDSRKVDVLISEVKQYITNLCTPTDELNTDTDWLTDTSAWNFFTAVRAAFVGYKKKLETSLLSLADQDSTSSQSPNHTDPSFTPTDTDSISYPKTGKGE